MPLSAYPVPDLHLLLASVLNEFVESTLSSASLQTLGAVCTVVSGNAQAVIWNGTYTEYTVNHNGRWVSNPAAWNAQSAVESYTSQATTYCQSLQSDNE